MRYREREKMLNVAKTFAKLDVAFSAVFCVGSVGNIDLLNQTSQAAPQGAIWAALGWGLVFAFAVFMYLVVAGVEDGSLYYRVSRRAEGFAEKMYRSYLEVRDERYRKDSGRHFHRGA